MGLPRNRLLRRELLRGEKPLVGFGQPRVDSAAHAPDIADAGLGTGNNSVLPAGFGAFSVLMSDRHR